MTKTYETLATMMEEALSAVRARCKAEFEAKGGCPNCKGWGRVLVWWTLDGACYDEFGVCTAPGCTASTVGKLPGSMEPGSLPRAEAPLLPTAEEKAVIDEISAELQSLNRLYEEIEEEKRVRKGAEVVVVRGRKVPLGTTGVVFWTGTASYGAARYFRSAGYTTPRVEERIGVRDASGNVHWTSASNVEVLL